MPRKLLAAAVLSMFAFPFATGQAQLHYGVAGGLSAPLGDFGDVADAGYHLTGLLSVSMPLAPIGFRIEGSFNEFKYKSSISSIDAKARIWSGTANAVLSSPGIIGPYLIGGLGIYNAYASCDGCNSSSTKGGLNGGAGLKLGLSGFSAFIEARYHYIPGGSDATTAGTKSSTQYIHISVGVTFCSRKQTEAPAVEARLDCRSLLSIEQVLGRVRHPRNVAGECRRSGRSIAAHGVHPLDELRSLEDAGPTIRYRSE
jgi:hypothetical protein